MYSTAKFVLLNEKKGGVKVTQTSIDVVARNIANAGTDGYTRKLTTQEARFAGDQGLGAKISSIYREVDYYVQEQLFIEESRLSYTAELASYLNRVDEIFGTPGGPGALDTRLNELTLALQDLSTQPESPAARAAVVNQAEGLSSNLRRLTDNVQGLRQLAEDTIAEGIADLNNLLEGLAQVNGQVAIAGTLGAGVADLKDQRDLLVSKISEYLEVTVNEDVQGRALVYTKSGNILVDSEAVTLSFDRFSNLNANSFYSSDSAERGVGTVSLSGSNSYNIDLIENGILDTGKFGALIELRDTILPEAQRQLDDLAAGLALALSSNEVSSSAATAGAATGFDIDISNVERGNVIHLQYTDNTGPTVHNISIIRVDDPSALPLSNDATSDPNDEVIGIDWTGGDAAIAAALSTALGADITVTSPSSGVIRILDDGAVGNSDINSLSATVTATLAQGGGLGFPLFTDTGNNLPFTGAVDGAYQKAGFAGRIIVNNAVKIDNELLVKYTTGTAIGDNARPLDLIERLTTKIVDFGAKNGIGSSTAPFRGTVMNFAQNLIAFQTSQSDRAELNLTAQEAVTQSLRSKYDEDVGVNIDEELASLIALQQAFAANARVMAVTGELMDLLIQAV